MDKKQAKHLKSNPTATKPPTKKKKIISISVLVIGLIALVVGAVFLVLGILKLNRAADADYLISAESWTLDGEPSVVWKFTEVGKGTLTTNDHLNDYDFIWAIEEDKLKIETDWLYNLENEYDYQLDQSSGTLTLTAGSDTYTFTATH